MSAVAAQPGLAGTASALRRLYFVRFAFALVWALVMFTMAKEITPVGAVLLVLYPLFDVGAAVYDARVSRSTGSPKLLYLNIAISSLTAVGLAFACASGVPAVLRVWGTWAVVAGLVQLIVAVPRRKMGGQWPMILSGGISTVAGGTFIASAGAEHPMLSHAVNYAIPGAVFFLIAALRLGRTTKVSE